MMASRAALVLALMLAAGLYRTHAQSPEVAVPRAALAALPMTIGPWEGANAEPLADDLLTQLGVDDYVNRQYFRDGASPIGLYVGYYASQRQGDTIHSPQNCLPGAGWAPVSSAKTTVQTGDSAVTVNQLLIQKGLDRQIVLYWYQGRGRVVANEYANKAYLMLDSARLHRTNGGLVRLVAPITSTPERAEANAAAFAALLFPHLKNYLP